MPKSLRASVTSSKDNPTKLRLEKKHGANLYVTKRESRIICETPYKGVDEYTNVKVECVMTVPSFYTIEYVKDDGQMFCRSVLEDGTIKPRVKPTSGDTVTVVQEVVVT